MCDWRTKNRNMEGFSPEVVNFSGISQWREKKSGKWQRCSDGGSPVSDGEEAEQILTWNKDRGVDRGGDQEIWKKCEGKGRVEAKARDGGSNSCLVGKEQCAHYRSESSLVHPSPLSCLPSPKWSDSWLFLAQGCHAQDPECISRVGTWPTGWPGTSSSAWLGKPVREPKERQW